MAKLRLLLVFLLFGLIVSVGVVGYTLIDGGKSVKFENQYGKIVVTPAVVYDWGRFCQEADLTSYLANGTDLDFAFEFANPVKGNIVLVQRELEFSSYRISHK